MHPKSSSKVKAYRARQRAGVAILKVPIGELEFCNALIEAGVLNPAQCLDRRELEAAAVKVLTEFSARFNKM